MPDTEQPAAPSGGGSGEERIKVTRPRVRTSRASKLGTAAGVIVCLMSIGLGTVAGNFYWGSAVLRRVLPTMGWGALTSGNPLAAWTPERQFPGQREMNVLIMGCDYDYDDYGRVVKSGARSDSILVAHVDFVNKRIAALTIPRDSAVYIPGHRGIHKINAAHALGGPRLAAETVKSVFGIPTDAYVELNFHGFQKLVDAIGGVDLNVAKKLDYDDNWGHLHIHLKPGYQHMNGYQAMGYVRMRHSDSDEMRSKRQHEFLEAVRTKLKAPGTFMALPKVIDTLHDSLQHDINDDQMYALMNFARSLPKENIQVATLPSFEGPSYVTIDTDKSALLIQQMFFPNQMVAYNIDAPDPNSVRSMNAPYERGRSRHTRHRRSRGRAEQGAEGTTGTGGAAATEGSTEGNGRTDSGDGAPAGGTDSGGSPSEGDGGTSGGSGSPGGTSAGG